MSDIRMVDETAAFVKATSNLLAAVMAALVKHEPRLLFELEGQSFRITYGSDEKMLLIALVDDNGQSVPFAGIHGNPAIVETFGRVGVPVVVQGMYDLAAPAQTH